MGVLLDFIAEDKRSDVASLIGNEQAIGSLIKIINAT